LHSLEIDNQMLIYWYCYWYLLRPDSKF